jgi:hypothetical protein
MEMFETDGQLVLNEYLGGTIDEARFSRDIRYGAITKITGQ